MDGIKEAVVRQLKEQKGGKDVLPLWEKLWKAYQEDGTRGVEEQLRELAADGSEQE